MHRSAPFALHERCLRFAPGPRSNSLRVSMYVAVSPERDKTQDKVARPGHPRNSDSNLPREMVTVGECKSRRILQGDTALLTVEAR